MMFVKTIIALSLAILAVAAPGPQPQGSLGTVGQAPNGGEIPNGGETPNNHRDLSGGRIAARAPQPQGTSMFYLNPCSCTNLTKLRSREQS
ncbi:hypothetical protein BJV78DRAFT_145591 [Lactifluus subvellereus]|nr:hypothetical protein BJV78DRAFT_145591 [Lactifluus subvellereus]